MAGPLAMLLALAGSPAWAAGPVRELKVRFLEEPRVLDWQLAATGLDAGVIVNLMEGLVRIGEKNELVPALAESWTIAADGRELTFRIRSGAKWSDGAAVTSGQFADAWRRLLAPETKAPYPFALYAIEGAEEFNAGRLTDFSKVGISAPDPQTLRIRLKDVYSAWIYNLSWWPTFPIRKDKLDAHGDLWSRPENLVTAGPYTLAGHRIGREMLLERNPHHYERRGNVGLLRLLFITDDFQAFQLYLKGEVDILPRVAIRKETAGARGLRRFPPIKTVKLDFNQLKTPMNDVRVRRAIAQGVDWKGLKPFLARGYRPAASFVPEWMNGGSSRVGVPYDPAKARAALKEAGYGPERPLTIDVATLLLDDYTALLSFVEKELGALGIKVRPSFHAIADLNSGMHDDPTKYHATIYSLSAKSPDPDYLVGSYLSGSPNNHTGWKNPAYDELVRKARVAPTDAARAEALLQAQRLLVNDEVVMLPLYYDEYWVMVRPGVKGFIPNPFSFFQFRSLTVP